MVVVEKPDGDGNWPPGPPGQWMIKRLAALPGDPVPAHLATLPEPLTGTVDTIGRLVVKQGIYSSDPSAPTDARVVEVVVRLDRPELANRLINLQAQVTIKLAEAKK